jgi:sugar/nucleoside kinase (ribokinase family)
LRSDIISGKTMSKNMLPGSKNGLRIARDGDIWRTLSTGAVREDRMMYLVVGSVHLEIFFTAMGAATSEMTGDISVEIGGTAGNVALQLRRMGAEVCLVTAMNSSAHSKFILDHLQNAGIEVRVISSPLAPLGAVISNMDSDGALISSVSSTPIEQVKFDRSVVDIASFGGRLSAVIVDSNLPIGAISFLAKFSAENCIPVYAVASSPLKSLKIADAVKFGARFDGIFLGRDEVNLIKAKRFSASLSDSNLSAVLSSTTVVCEAGNGVVVSENRSAVHHMEYVRKGAAFLRKGAKDAFVAMSVYGCVDKGQAMQESTFNALHALIKNAQIGLGAGGMES